MALSKMNSGIVGFGLVAILLASGCHMVAGSEDEGWWYCDDGGCYECTPFGCRGVPDDRLCDGMPCGGVSSATGTTACGETPCQNPDPSCSISSDCRAGYICIKGGCVPGKPGACESHETCGDGAACVDGECQDTGLCTADKEAACASHGEGYTCDDRGTCVPPVGSTPPDPPPVETCAAATACDGGFCVDGTCTQCSADDCGEAKTCQLDRHCGEGRVCLDGQCTASCAEGADSCASGQVCKSGVCVADDALFCTAAADCAGARLCVNNACLAACTDTGACAKQGDLCSGAIAIDDGDEVKVCRPDHRAELECQLTKDCEGGEVCTNGICRTVCDAAEDCAVCDDGPVCGPGGFCMTAAEAKPACTLNSDCTGDGAICLGAQCITL